MCRNVSFSWFQFWVYVAALNLSTCSAVGIATGYGLDGPGIECRWGDIFHTRPDRPWGLTSLLYNGCRVFTVGKTVGGGGVLKPHPHLQCRRLKLGTAIPITALRALPVCYRDNIYFTFTLYIHSWGLLLETLCMSKTNRSKMNAK